MSFVLPSEDVGNITVAGDGENGPVRNKPPGSMHGDFMNGWNQAQLTELIETCINSVPDTATTDEKPVSCQDPERNA